MFYIHLAADNGEDVGNESTSLTTFFESWHWTVRGHQPKYAPHMEQSANVALVSIDFVIMQMKRGIPKGFCFKIFSWLLIFLECYQ